MSEEISFKEFAKIWFEQSSLGLCYTYRNNMKSAIDHMIDFFGDKKIQDIKPMDITTMINELSKNNPNTNNPMAKQTLFLVVNTANRIFDFAIDNELIDKNPARGKKKNIPKNAPKTKVNGITKVEQNLIINTMHRCRIAALIMMLMGLRTSEMLALQWRNIDFDSKRAYIGERASRVSSNRYQVKAGNKRADFRYVTIPDNLCSYLYKEMKNAKSNLVFPKTDGTLNTPSSWRSAWTSYNNTLSYNYCKQTQSKYSPKGYPKLIEIDAHQLRHTYATLLYLSGMDALAASKLLGHKSVKTTLDIYTDLDTEFEAIDISNFNEYLSSDLYELL